MNECYSLIDAEKSWLKNKCKNISPFVTDYIITPVLQSKYHGSVDKK